MLCFLSRRDGARSTTGRTWPAHPAGLRFTCTGPCSGWIRCSLRWAPPTTPYRLSPRLHCPQPCGCPHPQHFSLSSKEWRCRSTCGSAKRTSLASPRVFSTETQADLGAVGLDGLVCSLLEGCLNWTHVIAWERRTQSEQEATGRYLIFVTNCNNLTMTFIMMQVSSSIALPPHLFLIVLLHWLIITSSHLNQNKQTKRLKSRFSCVVVIIMGHSSSPY